MTAPGSTCKRPVNLIDLYPTLVDLCGLGAKPELDGLSLVPLLKNPNAKWQRPSLITHECGNHTLRTERWRYIRYSDGTEELYDHKQDPNEWNNLAGKPEHAAIKKDMVRWLPKTDAPGVPVKGAYKFDPKTYTWTKKRNQ